jgi:hypothetical protein
VGCFVFSLGLRVLGLRVFLGLLGFLLEGGLLWAILAVLAYTSCVHRGAVDFFNKIFYLSKKVMYGERLPG